MPIAVYALPVVGIQHLMAHQWLSSFVCRFLIELCGLCTLSWASCKMYWTWISPSFMLVILQVEFLVGIFVSHFGQFTVEDWEPFHSISGSLSSLAGVHLDFNEQASSANGVCLWHRVTSNATTYGSTLGIWTLQTLIWLLISPSWLLLIIHGIGNLTQTCLVHWLSRTIRETSSACIHSIRGLSPRTLDLMITDIWTLGHWTFIWWCRWRTTSINQDFYLWSPSLLQTPTR